MADPQVLLLPCPKCGHPDTSMRWCGPGQRNRPLAGHCETTEHFHRCCARCGYLWETTDMLDMDTEGSTDG